MKDFPSATDTALFTSQETSILEDPYRKEVLLDNWAHERKKTKYALFSVGLVLLIFNLVGATTAGISITDNLGALVLFPALFIGLGFFAHLQPMIAVIGGVLVILGITVLKFIEVGAISFISGWLYKVIALYFIIKGIRHAQEAERAKKELEQLV